MFIFHCSLLVINLDNVLVEQELQYVHCQIEQRATANL